MSYSISGVSVQTGDPRFDLFFDRIKDFLLQDRSTLEIDGQRYRGYRSPDSQAIWIRDHSDMLRGARYFDDDLQSAVTHFAEMQARNGRILDYFTYGPEKNAERENWLKYVRVPVEADVEFRFVKAIFLAWQASGDDEWMFNILPAAENALDYATSHPWRWHAPLQLVKRAYTIDTWDFDYTAGRHNWLNFQITPDTFWGIMHGDNSGYYEAMRLLAHMLRHVGWSGKAANWLTRADELRQRANEVCWNGKFYRHFVPLTGVKIDGVDEQAQLSLSNPMAINRGMADHAMAVAILREYQHRKKQNKPFAEWYSIDPPFPDGIFGDEKLVAGAYCNGGIMPLVGGEIARAAFEHGFEEYGVQTLRQYASMIEKTGETYLWYFPNGQASSVETSTSPEAIPTDGWGSSAMLYAFVEGLCGLVDRNKLFDAVWLAPRWHAAGVNRAEVAVGYANGSGVRYLYHHDKKAGKISFQVTVPNTAQLHLLLPSRKQPKQVLLDGQNADFQLVSVEQSLYLDMTFKKKGQIDITLGE